MSQRMSQAELVEALADVTASLESVRLSCEALGNGFAEDAAHPRRIHRSLAALLSVAIGRLRELSVELERRGAPPGG